MSLPRLVPWLNWEEWLNVRDGLFSSEAQKQDWALGVISSWRIRGKIPFPIESTATFIDLTLKDIEDENPFDTQAKRLYYSMALTRFVNFVVDVLQQGRVALSISALADKLGLPQVFVDLRHEATHGELPSLQVLRFASKKAISWLQENYWEKQGQILEDLSNKIRHQLTAYIENLKGIESFNQQLLEICLDEIHSNISSNGVRDLLIPIILQEYIFIGDYNSSRAIGWKIAKWTPLIRKFCIFWPYFANYFISSITDSMKYAGTLTDLSDLQKLNVELSYKLVELVLSGQKGISKGKSTNRGTALHFSDLIEVLLRYPTPWSCDLMDTIKSCGYPMSDRLYGFIKALSSFPESFSLLLSQSQETELNSQKMLSNLEAIKSQIASVKEHAAKGELQDNARWTAQKNWPHFALGLLPDGSLPSLELPDFFKDVSDGHPLYYCPHIDTLTASVPPTGADDMLGAEIQQGAGTLDIDQHTTPRKRPRKLVEVDHSKLGVLHFKK